MSKRAPTELNADKKHCYTRDVSVLKRAICTKHTSSHTNLRPSLPHPTTKATNKPINQHFFMISSLAFSIFSRSLACFFCLPFLYFSPIAVTSKAPWTFLSVTLRLRTRRLTRVHSTCPADIFANFRCPWPVGVKTLAALQTGADAHVHTRLSLPLLLPPSPNLYCLQPRRLHQVFLSTPNNPPPLPTHPQTHSVPAWLGTKASCVDRNCCRGIHNNTSWYRRCTLAKVRWPHFATWRTKAVQITFTQSSLEK